MRYRDITTCSLLDALKAGSTFSQGGLNLEEFIMDVHVPLLLPVCVKEFTDWYMEWRELQGLDLKPIWLPSLLFHFLSIRCGLEFNTKLFFYD